MSLQQNTPATMLALLIFAARLEIVLPLSVVCLFVLVAIPMGARRGKLTIPACVGMGLGAAVLALAMGKLAGANGVRGTTAGILVAMAFYLMVATAVGSFIGLYFFREPPQQ